MPISLWNFIQLSVSSNWLLFDCRDDDTRNADLVRNDKLRHFLDLAFILAHLKSVCCSSSSALTLKGTSIMMSTMNALEGGRTICSLDIIRFPVSVSPRNMISLDIMKRSNISQTVNIDDDRDCLSLGGVVNKGELHKRCSEIFRYEFQNLTREIE